MSEYNQSKHTRVAALRYRQDEDSAPVVVAAGAGYVAGKILDVAEQCGIAVYHDDNASTLLSKLDLGQKVPPELYQMVADIYLTILMAADSVKEPLSPVSTKEEPR